MKKLLIILTLLILSSMVFGQHYIFDSVLQNGGIGSDFTYDVCVDANGYKYITGKYNGTIDFGYGISITPIHNYDIFVAKFNQNNEIQWAQSFGGYSADEGRTVSVDADGNVIVTASFFATVTFGSDTLFSHGNFDVVIVKFDANGNYLWMKQIYTNNQDKTSDMQIDSDGNYIIVGYYGNNAIDTLRYEGLEIVSNGEREIFVLKTDNNGNPIWGVTGGGTDNDYPSGLVVDGSNNIYFTGYYLNVNTTFGATVLPNLGGKDVFIAKINSAGEYQWAVAATGPGDDEAKGIEYVYHGTNVPAEILVTGFFTDTLYVGPSATLHESVGGRDIFVLAYTDAGDYEGEFLYGKDADDEGVAINSIKGAGGDYYISGLTKSNLISNGDTLLNYGLRDIFVMKINQDSLIWAKNYGGASDDYINSACIDDNGIFYLAGNFKSSPAKFDPFLNVSMGVDLWLGQMKAHTVVYFECNLAVQIANNTFDTEHDAVFVRGDFQTDAKDPNGNWQGNLFQLLDEDLNKIYSTIINLPSDTGKVYNYLFIINDEMESIDKREFVLYPPDTWLNQAFFNSDAIPSIPLIYSISDIPNDQGGKVRISFSTSTTNTSYSVWRKMNNNGWDAVGSFNAIQDSNYHFVSPTLGDSTVKGIVWSTFRISAHTANPKVFYMSAADSGYSIDNLAPSVPLGVIATGYDEKVELLWDENVEKDFQYYEIYRSIDSEFNTDTMKTPTYSTIENKFDDLEVIQSTTYYYVVTAVDYSGNKSGFSQKVFTIVADVKSGAEIPTVYKLGQNYPNPFNPSTTIKYSIPSNKTPLMRGVVGVFVTLKIYDILGREVETLVNEQQKAGNYEVNFDASTLSSGIYFYRLQSYSFVESKKMILIK